MTNVYDDEERSIKDEMTVNQSLKDMIHMAFYCTTGQK